MNHDDKIFNSVYNGYLYDVEMDFQWNCCEECGRNVYNETEFDSNFESSEYGGTILMVAAKKGYVDIVDYLLKLDITYSRCITEIDVDIQDHNGNTALMYASENGHLDVVNRLLECKQIDVDIQYEYGFSPLKYASENGHLDIVNRLKEWQQNRICEGFTLYLLTDYALYIPKDISELIIEFSIS